MNIYDRKENESLYEYQIRLSLGILNKEVGYEELEWEDVKELLGSTKHRDSLRKEAYGLKIYDEYIKSKTKEMIAQEEYDKLLSKELEIKKEKTKLQDLRTLINRQSRELARKENLGEILENKLESLPTNVINMNTVERETSHKDGIAVWSDWHFGEGVDIFLNKFNPDICRDRVNYLVDKTIEYSKLNNIDKIHIFLLGDLISNENYTTIRLLNRENLMEQIVNVSQIVSEAIYKISCEVPYVTVGFTTGNHCRVHPKGENLNKDNYTTLIKEFVKIKLNNVSNLIFLENEYDNEIITANVCGNFVVGTHGDKLNKKQASYDISSLLNKKVDVLLVGHFHEMATEVNHDTVVVRNGSLVGSNEYSRNMNLHTRPCQRFLIVSKNGVDCVYNIFLDKLN